MYKCMAALLACWSPSSCRRPGSICVAVQPMRTNINGIKYVYFIHQLHSHIIFDSCFGSVKVTKPGRTTHTDLFSSHTYTHTYRFVCVFFFGDSHTNNSLFSIDFFYTVQFSFLFSFSFFLFDIIYLCNISASDWINILGSYHFLIIYLNIYKYMHCGRQRLQQVFRWISEDKGAGNLWRAPSWLFDIVARLCGNITNAYVCGDDVLAMWLGWETKILHECVGSKYDEPSMGTAPSTFSHRSTGTFGIFAVQHCNYYWSEQSEDVMHYWTENNEAYN